MTTVIFDRGNHDSGDSDQDQDDVSRRNDDDKDESDNGDHVNSDDHCGDESDNDDHVDDDGSDNDDRVDGDGGMVAGGRLPNADYPVVGPSLIIIPLPPAAVIIKAFLSSSGSSLLSTCHRHKYTHIQGGFFDCSALKMTKYKEK